MPNGGGDNLQARDRCSGQPKEPIIDGIIKEMRKIVSTNIQDHRGVKEIHKPGEPHAFLPTLHSSPLPQIEKDKHHCDKMPGKFQDQVVLITGAASGIGYVEPSPTSSSLDTDGSKHESKVSY